MATKLRCCNNCIYLNIGKEQYSDDDFSVRVGCNASNDGFAKFWLAGDRNRNELNYCGCYYFKDTVSIGTIFHLFTENNKYICQYCGKIDNKYLIWNQTYRTFKLVEKEWFKLHRKQIQVKCERTTVHGCMVTTRHEKQSFRKRLAKHRKEVYLKQCQK